MMKRTIVLLLLSISILMAESSYYSQNELGIMGNALSVRSQGMGQTGGAIMDSISITSENPAFWYNFQTTSLQGFLDYSNQFSEKGENGFRTSNLGGFALKFPVGEYVGVALGLKPEYRTDYTTTNLDSVPFDGEMINFYNKSELKGGISEAFLGFGYKLGSRLSLGAKAKLLFGNYNFYNYTDKNFDNSNDTRYYEKLKMSGLQTEFGIGWVEKNNFSLGIAYSLHNTFKYRTKIDYNFGPDSSNAHKKVKMPNKFTISLHKKLLKQLYFTTDLYYQGEYTDFVNEVAFFDEVKSNDSYFIGAGIERVHPQRWNSDLWKNFDYRAGIYYRNQPFYKENSEITDLGLSVGLGVPMNMNQTILDISFQYIRRSGYLEDEIGLETIYKVNFGITTGGLWFRR